MKILMLSLSLLFQTLASATGVDCGAILDRVPLETATDGMYFDRWNLPGDLHFGTVLDALMRQVPEGRATLIFDTNPDARKWHGRNIFGPQADILLPALGYAQLTDSQRNWFFADFADRIEHSLGADEKPVLIIDHHFRSPLLAEISTTPLVVDFVTWLNAHPERREVRRALREGFVLRDHSDPDIVLASFALRLLDRPERLAKWAALLRRIALLNDHAQLDPQLTPRDRGETLVDLIMLEAFEKEIPRRFPTGFAWALDNVELGLSWVREAVATWPANESDPIGRFLTEASLAPPALRQIFATMKTEGETKRALSVTLQQMFATGQNLVHRGRSLILRFPDSQPSGLDVLQFLRLNPRLIPAGVKVILMAGKKAGRDASQVKLRVTDPSFSLDGLFNAIAAKGIGGGGRASAGALYGTSGEVKTESELDADLAWTTEQIEKL